MIILCGFAVVIPVRVYVEEKMTKLGEDKLDLSRDVPEAVMLRGCRFSVQCSAVI